MDKKATIALATVVGVTALGGVYLLGLKNSSNPTPVSPSAAALPPIDQPARVAPAVAGQPAAIVPAVATVPGTAAPRDTVSLLPAQTAANPNLAAQTPTLDKTTTVSEGNQVAYVGPSGRPSLATPMNPATEVETKTIETKQVTGPTSVSTSSHTTVHTASTHKSYTYHKHQKSGNVHVARATKHTVMFAAKLPFRLRP